MPMNFLLTARQLIIYWNSKLEAWFRRREPRREPRQPFPSYIFRFQPAKRDTSGAGARITRDLSVGARVRM